MEAGKSEVVEEVMMKEGEEKDGHEVEGGDVEYYDEDTVKSVQDFMHKLEDFCASPYFTTAIGDFTTEYAGKFEDKEEHPPECFVIFQKYDKMIEEKLEGFVKEQGLTNEEVAEACRIAMDIFPPGTMTCLDFILASLDFESFHALMLDFRAMQE
uniref:Cilia- and flagella-associated protein 36 n=1 Tax=Palpitomonas bilix TaxID=652834 RepID=A0A7S3GEU7_9EUKA|mmetsp:Transcript_46222/g.119123  ORF Transcript_46222/g.119123 Transcript_46222/m.119123 type:complete len:155 (+) Transcript_46222:212-676(+)|eukprot:CAMPEP_0113881394 /NCGR_PEP_ID=MMETSP0780_2-20120614/8352_1 /TAXON_ID=652834 /ORGANISM="Palpitomonas bilix" /LENGTH=154 /DNA_ID=CAMNT_0000868247 /DNA_START=212 /DNA_END=676 /DNA_ORIENTATION=- /assembly_acc=CAM_ASM_000599